MTNPPVERPRVLVLFGGRSSEHGVSCLSARSVLAALDRDRYDVVPVGITRGGRWVLTDGVIEPAAGSALPEVRGDRGPTVTLVRGRSGTRLVALEGPTGDEVLGDRATPDQQPDHARGWVDHGRIDVAFPVLHGPYGEDGTIQGLLASVGIPYVGADVVSSSVGVDKRAMKQAFKARGLPQVPYLPLTRARFDADRHGLAEQVEAALSYPVFTKPARQGSSIGISLCRHREELVAGLEEAFGYDRVVIVEQGLHAPRELEVGALGNDRVELTAPGEIRPSHDFYDFEAKYLDDSELVVPAKLDPALADRIAQIAREAYSAIGCRGMARIDFFVVDGDGPGEQLYLNEINTIPGFTPVSMFPQLWAAEGVAYPELVDRLLALAMEAADAEANFAP